MKRFATGFTIFAVVFWWWLVPFLVSSLIPVEFFVTNNRQDAPPRVFVTDGPFIPGEKGSPWVELDWLSHREFRDYRTVYIYEENALGRSVCAPLDLEEPPDGYLNRAGVSYRPPEGFSLDRWTAGQLPVECPLKPGKYVIVTEYRVPLLAGVFHTTFRFTSNAFEITS